MKRWIAAYNHPTCSWSSGGTMADYEHPHWDVFTVSATDHEEAVKLGRALRRSHKSLTPRQVALLNDLRGPALTYDPNSQDYLEVSEDELATVKQLERKQLLSISTTSDRMVRLTPYAFNPSLVGLA